MTRTAAVSLALVLAACGGGEPAADASSQPAASEPARAAASAASMGEMTMPDWFHVDDANQSVHMTITAGLTDEKNYWNFNGGHDGNMTITVPEGYEVTIDFVNNDPAMAHSLGISEAVSGNPGIVDPVAVFEGAITSNPTSMTEGTMPGQTETITFTAASAGSYSMVCYIPGHAAAGMWINFNVSGDGSKGVQGAM